jgi:hypothetical protein
MDKSDNAPRPVRRTRQTKQGQDTAGLEEELNRDFHEHVAETVPLPLKDLAHRLDRAIAEVVRKKTN